MGLGKKIDFHSNLDLETISLRQKCVQGNQFLLIINFRLFIEFIDNEVSYLFIIMK